MLVMSMVLVISVCLLVGITLVLHFNAEKAKAAIYEKAERDVDARTRKSADVDAVLVKELVDNKPTAAAIHRWQLARAEVLASGKTARPWDWDADDLGVWRDDQITTRCREVQHRLIINFGMTLVSVVVLTCAVEVILYHFASASGGSAVAAFVDPAAIAPPGDPNAPAVGTTVDTWPSTGPGSAADPSFTQPSSTVPALPPVDSTASQGSASDSAQPTAPTAAPQSTSPSPAANPPAAGDTPAPSAPASSAPPATANSAASSPKAAP